MDLGHIMSVAVPLAMSAACVAAAAIPVVMSRRERRQDGFSIVGSVPSNDTGSSGIDMLRDLPGLVAKAGLRLAFDGRGVTSWEDVL